MKGIQYGQALPKSEKHCHRKKKTVDFSHFSAHNEKNTFVNGGKQYDVFAFDCGIFLFGQRR